MNRFIFAGSAAENWNAYVMGELGAQKFFRVMRVLLNNVIKKRKVEIENSSAGDTTAGIFGNISTGGEIWKKILGDGDKVSLMFLSLPDVAASDGVWTPALPRSRDGDLFSS